MALKITIQGIVLTQAQVDAITPIVNERVNLRHMSQKQFDAKCVAMMAEKGCPLDLTKTQEL